jgi:hypothetical protein
MKFSTLDTKVETPVRKFTNWNEGRIPLSIFFIEKRQILFERSYKGALICGYSAKATSFNNASFR